MKGTSFTIKPGSLEKTTKKLAEQYLAIEKQIVDKTNKAVNLVFKTATAKRAMITVMQAKAEGRRKVNGKIKRVSNPKAEAGVPVDIGELKESIKKEVKTSRGKTIGRIWTDNDHAQAMEFGTSRIDARPFMLPAMEANKDAIIRAFKEKK